MYKWWSNIVTEVIKGKTELLSYTYISTPVTSQFIVDQFPSSIFPR